MTLLFISGTEIFFIMLTVVVLFGSKKVPEIAHGLGKTIRQIRNATDDIKNEIQKSAENHQTHKELSDVKKQINEFKDTVERTTSTAKATLEK